MFFSFNNENENDQVMLDIRALIYYPKNARENRKWMDFFLKENLYLHTLQGKI